MTCSGPDMLNTPSYASGAIIGLFVGVSLFIERSIHHLGKHLEKKKNKALLKALECMKEELMLLGFISLFLTVFENSFAGICVPVKQVRFTFLVCNREELPEVESIYNATEGETPHRRLLQEVVETIPGCPEGKAPFIGVEALHQIHIFIFTLAGVHILYSCVVMSLAYLKVERWSKWEREAVLEAKAYAENPSKTPKTVELSRVSTFQKRHIERTELWVVDWLHCFAKAVFQAVARADYKALRVAFLSTHHLSHDFAFDKFLLRSLEDDFSSIVEVTNFMWLFVLFFVIFDIPQGHIVYWLPDIFVSLILLVGAKLARVVQVLARDIDMERMGPCVGTHLRPRDSLFWFKRPSLMLGILHFVLFTNSFQLATLIFYAWQFGVDSCYFYNRPYTYLRVIISVLLILFTSWVTLPAYALVSQMGSHYRPTIFGEHVQQHIRGWANRHRKKEEEPKPLQAALGSVLQMVHADSIFPRRQQEAGSAHSDMFSAEDIESVMGAADFDLVVRPTMVDDAEQIGDGTVDGSTEANGRTESAGPSDTRQEAES